MRIPAAEQFHLEVTSSTATPTQGGAGAYFLTRPDGNRLVYSYGRFALQPGPRWQFSLSPTIVRETETKQYITTLNDGPADTYGKHYVFARVDRWTYSTQLRVNYTVKPDLTLDVYAEPFAASGAYGPTQELVAARSGELRPFAVPGNRDFNTKSFRSNVVLRWEWKPGSTLFVVWQQNRAATSPIGTRASIGDMFDSITAPGDHVVAVKTTFWISPR
jgi:hypothetical protein